MMWWTLIFMIIILLVTWYYMFYKKKHYDLKERHVFITGGSKGIGKCLAILALEQGAHVTVVARDSEALEQIKMDLLKKSVANQKVQAISVDVSGDYLDIEKAISDAEVLSGPIFLLMCCAGTSISHRFDDTPIRDFRRMMDVNYFGAVNAIKAALPSMKQAGEGHIVIFSSIAGLFGLYGFAAYSAAKFALVGLAEVLTMELKQHNIQVTVAYPPDTDTPGFAIEQITKPLETKRISESGGLYSAEAVAKKILEDAMNGDFASTMGFEGWMVRTVCSGFMPFTCAMEVILQVLTMGVFRLISVVFLKNCDRIINKCAKERQTNKKSS